jgi:ferredoxin
MTMRPVVDRDRCAGYGECARSAPEVFVLDEEDTATVTAAGLAGDHEAEARLAATACPMQAITLLDR